MELDNFPEIISKMNPVITNFLNALRPFEQGDKFDSGKLETYYQQIMSRLISDNFEKHNFYIGPELFDNEAIHCFFSLESLSDPWIKKSRIKLPPIINPPANPPPGIKCPWKTI